VELSPVGFTVISSLIRADGNQHSHRSPRMLSKGGPTERAEKAESSAAYTDCGPLLSVYAACRRTMDRPGTMPGCQDSKGTTWDRDVWQFGYHTEAVAPQLPGAPANVPGGCCGGLALGLPRNHWTRAGSSLNGDPLLPCEFLLGPRVLPAGSRR